MATEKVTESKNLFFSPPRFFSLLGAGQQGEKWLVKVTWGLCKH